jgi:hypothetical protein
MTTPDRPAAWVTTKPNLVAAFPAHVPMGLPLPEPTQEPDTPDEEYSL